MGEITMMRNPGVGRPWALLFSSTGRFEFQLFDTLAEACEAARKMAVDKLTSGSAYKVEVAELPFATRDALAIEAWIEHTDALLADVLAKKAP